MIEMIETIETIEMHTTSAPRVGFEKEVRRTRALRRRRLRSLAALAALELRRPPLLPRARLPPRGSLRPSLLPEPHPLVHVLLRSLVGAPREPFFFSPVPSAAAVVVLRGEVGAVVHPDAGEIIRRRRRGVAELTELGHQTDRRHLELPVLDLQTLVRRG